VAANVLTPPQVPSDNSGNFTTTLQHVSNGVNVHTQTYVIPKLTFNGTAGSMTVVNGTITKFTPAT
jgi:hypothetical protein